MATKKKAPVKRVRASTKAKKAAKVVRGRAPATKSPRAIARSRRIEAIEKKTRRLAAKRLPADLMRILAEEATASKTRGLVGLTARRRELVRLLKASQRAIRGWECEGTASLLHGYAYVGLAFRLGGPARAMRALEALSQSELMDGGRVAVRVLKEQAHGLTRDVRVEEIGA